MSRNAHPKGTAAHSGTTFLSRIEPITATVPFFGTVSSDLTNNTSRFINALDHHNVCIFQSDRGVWNAITVLGYFWLRYLVLASL